MTTPEQIRFSIEYLEDQLHSLEERIEEMQWDADDIRKRIEILKQDLELVTERETP